MRISENRTENNQPSVLRKATGITVGAAIGVFPFAVGIRNFTKPLDDKKIARTQKKLSNMITEIDSFEKIKKYADKIIIESGLKDKKLKVEVWTPEVLKKIKPLPEAKTRWQKIKNTLTENNRKTFANGINAAFNLKKNIICINKKRLYSAVFHEIGHAMNYHLSPFTKMLQKVRVVNFITLPLFATACLGFGLFTDKKAKHQKKSEHNKFADFVHNNAGKLVLLYGAPIVAEEALATKRGLNAAKKYLTPAQHQLHIKNQAGALSTYIGAVLIAAGAVALGIFVKDKIVGHKKPQE